jgi:hypothetical protein
MEWLTQNWTYLLLLIGVILFMRFGGMGCGFGGRRARPAHGPDHPGGADTPVEAAPDQFASAAGDDQKGASHRHHGGCC